MNKGKGQFSRMSNPPGDTILIVDDEPANLAVVANYLANSGFRIKVARTGETGLELARRIPPDLILLDVLLPGIDGIEVCRRLKADARTRAVPVIFMTIVTNVEEKIKGFDVGGVDYITKPFQRAEVLARVTTHLTVHRLQQELRELNRALEDKVAARTMELTTANQQLQRDITARKQMEAALAAQEREFRTLAENSPDNIARYDVNCRTVYVNPTLEKTLGCPASEILGKTSVETNLIDESGRYQERIAAVIETGEETEIDLVMPGRGEGVRYHNIRFVTERGEDGAITGVLAIGRDVTERMQAEEEIRLLNQELEQRVADRTAKLEAANKELEAFAYSVSHDLRAPLRHIDGFIELLEKKAGTALNEQGRHYMDAISGATHKMGLLIENLLSFSRMGRRTISLQPVELEPLVRDVIVELEPDAAARAIQWRIDDLPVVDGDAAMLRIVLTNLIANAVKFTRPRKQAQIEIGSIAGETSEAVVFVRDNGVGFDMSYVDKLFGVFQRLHRAEDFEGTGIGLANVRRIIARHGGRTWAEGKVNQGAMFCFSLPSTTGGRGK